MKNGLVREGTDLGSFNIKEVGYQDYALHLKSKYCKPDGERNLLAPGRPVEGQHGPLLQVVVVTLADVLLQDLQRPAHLQRQVLHTEKKKSQEDL